MFYISFIISKMFANIKEQRDGLFWVTREHSNPGTMFTEKEDSAYFYRWVLYFTLRLVSCLRKQLLNINLTHSRASLPLNIEDYEGGETKFPFKKCPNITDPPKKGNMLVYPNR